MLDQDANRQVTATAAESSLMNGPLARYRVAMRRVMLVDLPWSGAVAAVFAFAATYYLPGVFGLQRDPAWWQAALLLWVAMMVPWFMMMKPMRPSAESVLRQSAREAEFRSLKRRLEPVVGFNEHG